MPKPFKSGKAYQNAIFERLLKLINFAVADCVVTEVKGAKSGSDILVTYNNFNIGLECKNRNAFEGGSKKMKYDGKRLIFEDNNSIHSNILGNAIIYDGLNLPWYEGKRNVDDWNQVEQVFRKDVYIEASDDSISSYYMNIGTFYIQIEGMGLYHTGNDILNVGVPFFCCSISLRIRSSKHKKKGIPTDITGALVYNKKSIPVSCYSLDIDGKLPKYISLIKI